MTEAETQQLHELSAELSAAELSPWQPRTISRAFTRRGLGEVRFTMQVWIDLDAAQSPLLLGDLPENLAQTTDAFDAFELDLGEPEEAVLICEAMQRAIADAFAAALPMRPEKSAADEDDGFGDWAPMLATVIAQLGLSRSEALATDVAQAFILIAAHRRNQGWSVAGVPYRLRDLGEGETA